MFRIVNNKVYITRGQTATYKGVVRKSDGTPYRMDNGWWDDEGVVKAKFTVTQTAESAKAVFVKEVELVKNSYGFDTSVGIVDGDDIGEDGVILNLPGTDYSNYLYKHMLNGVPTYYRYSGTTAPIGWSSTISPSNMSKFDCVVAFSIDSGDTSDLMPRTYKYQITLEVRDKDDTLTFKDYLLEYKDFEVGGSLSEQLR